MDGSSGTEQAIERSPMERVRPPKTPTKLVRVLREADTAKVLEACRGKGFVGLRDEALIRLQYQPTPNGWRYGPPRSRCSCFSVLQWAGLAVVSVVGIGWLAVLWRRAPRPYRMGWRIPIPESQRRFES
jgi:hypothetical protein